MPSSRVPSYGLHAASGQARVYIDGRSVYLGPHGSDESKRRYKQVIDRWRTQASARCSPDLSVGQLAILFAQHAKSYYVKGGKQTSEVDGIKAALRFVVGDDAHTLAADYGPKKLKAARDRMIAAGLSRNTINQNCGRIRRMFSWGVSEELVPPEVLTALHAVQGLRAGRSDAKERPPIRPVDLRAVLAIRRAVSRQVMAMIVLQLRTGARPGEIVQLRGVSLDQKRDQWTFTPGSHKTEHHGRGRDIPIGRRAQRIITRFLKDDPQAFFFSPIDAERERNEGRRAARRSPMTPSHTARKAMRLGDRERPPKASYDVTSYRRAIARACKVVRIAKWHPNQLRHWTGTRIRRQHGLETARAVLGHASAAVTEIYAERDLQSARDVMAQIG